MGCDITMTVVGTRGENSELSKLSGNHFDAIYNNLLSVLRALKDSNYPVSCLIGDGSTWASHAAVKAFLRREVRKLKLYVPVKFRDGAFDEGISGNLRNNPGKVYNMQHFSFKSRTQVNSLSNIRVATLEGAEVNVICDTARREKILAMSDILFVSSFAANGKITDPRLVNITNNYLGRASRQEIFDKSFHYDLNTGDLMDECITTTPSELQFS